MTGDLSAQKTDPFPEYFLLTGFNDFRYKFLLSYTVKSLLILFMIKPF